MKEHLSITGGDGNILFTQWKDNSVVSTGTNFSSITPLNKKNR